MNIARQLSKVNVKLLPKIVLVAAMFGMGLQIKAASMGEPHVYKNIKGNELNVYVVKPPGWRVDDHRPAIVLFHGGGWVGGAPVQMLPQAEYFAKRGMVSVLVEYRLLNRKTNNLPIICIQDARSAMRYVRSHAKDLGIDPQRIAACGGSAGGHLAAFVGLMNGFDDPQDNTNISPKADALVLFNPVYNNGPGNWGYNRVKDRYREFSPADNVSSNAPPTVVFLGTQDKLIPVATAKKFQSEMEGCGVRCETFFYEGQAHGFFNREPWLSKTLVEADRFLTSLGWLTKTTATSSGRKVVQI